MTETDEQLLGFLTTLVVSARFRDHFTDRGVAGTFSRVLAEGSRFSLKGIGTTGA